MTDDRDRYLAEIAAKRVQYIIGADEVGLGSWAGPLCVCAAVVPIGWRGPLGLNDSKKVRPNKRDELFWILRDRVSAYTFELASPNEIDTNGVTDAVKRCFDACLTRMKEEYPDSIVVTDGLVRVPDVGNLTFPKADAEVPAVMAASILAKVHRDRLMVEMGREYPGYGFGVHSGYGTPDHKRALLEKGPSPIHRQSYLPIKDLSELEDEEGLILERE